MKALRLKLTEFVDAGLDRDGAGVSKLGRGADRPSLAPIQADRKEQGLIRTASGE